MELTEEKIEKLLKMALEQAAGDDAVLDEAGITEDEYVPVYVETFEEACLLTRDKGVVLSVEDAEFQISIVKSR